MSEALEHGALAREVSQVTVGVRMTRWFPASCDSRAIVVRYRHISPVKYTAWSLKKAVARSVAVSWIIWGKSAQNNWNW
ncbi:putative transposase [Escherichia coli 1-176-05_S1_C3]|nr:putative transposase [Escherichia coli 1-176-05_S1_C3]